MSNGVKTSIDTFNENALNPGIWNYPQGTTFITVSSGALHISPDSSYPYAQSKAKYDLTTTIMAVKWNAGTGTSTASTTFIISADDAAATPNQVLITWVPSGNGWQIQAAGAATVSGTVNGTGTLGTPLANGTWVGMGNLGSDNVIRFYTSTDGVTWTQFGSATVGGTFAKTGVKFRIQVGHYTSSESPTWVSNIDEAAVFAAAPLPRVKVRVGGAWVYAVPKVRVGGAWVIARPRTRVSGAWVVTT
jgi:hypothetical protein